MEIIIDYQSKTPIYEQIVLQIKTHIMNDCLKKGESLPPMRSFAKSLGGSVITIQKAYEQLQAEGFINSVVGRGSFVSVPQVSVLKRQKQGEIAKKIQELIDEALANGYEIDELKHIFFDKCNLYEISKFKEEF